MRKFLFRLNCSGHVELAIKSYKQALTLRPDFPEATCNLLHTLQVHLVISLIEKKIILMLSFCSVLDSWKHFLLIVIYV